MLSPRFLDRSRSASTSSAVSGSDGAAAKEPLPVRQLIRPTSQIPWSVDVVRSVPRRVVAALPSAIAGCTAVGWAAATMGDGYVYVWQPKTTALADPLEAPKQFLKIFLPDLILETSKNNQQEQPPNHQRIFLAISPSGTPVHQSSSSGRTASTANDTVADAINLFAYHDGWLLLRKLTTKDLQNARSSSLGARAHTTKTKIDFGADTTAASAAPGPTQERATSLTAAPGLLVLATSLGNLYWVTLTPVPVGLHVQKIAPEKGWFSRLVFGEGSGASGAPSLVLPLGPTGFFSLSSKGSQYGPAIHLNLLRWRVSVTVGTAHHATFEPLQTVALQIPSKLLSDPQVLQATLAADGDSIHCLVQGIAPSSYSSAEETGPESRLYWIQIGLEDGKILRSHWLSRFAEPSRVFIVGLTVAENGNAYAAFYQESMGIVVIMALLDGNEIVQEVDLPSQQVPFLVPGMLEPDTTTHGCCVLASSGIGLRVRHLPPYDASDAPASKRRKGSSLSTTPTNASLLQNLVSHLRSSFWQAYQDPETHRPLPPSLRSAADPEDLDKVVVAFATELQHKGDAASSQNPMEWHRALIGFLQEKGLYRSLSGNAKWKLLAVGQELAVFDYCMNRANRSFPHPPSYNLSEWLLELQESNDTNTPEWMALLGGALEVAMVYREETANLLYDVRPEEVPPQPVWLGQLPLQKVLLRQLEAWRRSDASGVDRTHVESVSKAALRSYSESHPDKEIYARVRSLAIGLLRSHISSSNEALGYDTDELAFELCIQYHYFEGLCQISVDHEQKRDSSAYSLDPLFATIRGVDLLSGFSFPQFVLQWHTDKGLYGHAINYGQHSPADLNLIMNKDERLRQYKWIPAVRQSYYEQATESCLAICNADKTLSSTQWALSMAKLFSKLVATQNEDRAATIDRKLDLVDAQRMLEAEDPQRSLPLKQPEELVWMALQKLEEASSMDDKIRFATIALAVCSAMEDSVAALDHTAHVWAEALRLDDSKWNTWLTTEEDLSSPGLRDRILSSSVFGVLLGECRKEASSMSSVTYGRHIESVVLDKVGADGNKLELSRLLRSVASQSNTIKGQSLVVASF